MRKFIAVIFTCFFLFGMITACGDEGAEEEVALTQAQINCQATCSMMLQCDSSSSMTTESLDDCKTWCTDETYAAAVVPDAVAINCYRDTQNCQEFMDCRFENGPDEVRYGQWCRNWCIRCTECLAGDPEFDEVMCMDGNEAYCLDECQLRYNRASQACENIFENFRPETASCDEIDTSNPFAAGGC